MFEVPGSDIISVTVTKDAVLGEALPRYTYSRLDTNYDNDNSASDKSDTEPSTQYSTSV